MTDLHHTEQEQKPNTTCNDPQGCRSNGEPDKCIACCPVIPEPVQATPTPKAATCPLDPAECVGGPMCQGCQGKTTTPTPLPGHGPDCGTEPCAECFTAAVTESTTDTTPPLAAHIAPEARWGWIAQRGTESPEDAEAAQTIVRAFHLMSRAYNEQRQMVDEVLTALDVEQARIVGIIEAHVPHDGYCSMDDCGGCEIVATLKAAIRGEATDA